MSSFLDVTINLYYVIFHYSIIIHLHQWKDIVSYRQRLIEILSFLYEKSVWKNVTAIRFEKIVKEIYQKHICIAGSGYNCYIN
jgi:hypothetical protein